MQTDLGWALVFFQNSGVCDSHTVWTRGCPQCQWGQNTGTLPCWLGAVPAIRGVSLEWDVEEMGFWPNDSYSGLALHGWRRWETSV